MEKRLAGAGVHVDIEHSYLLHRPDQVTVAGVGARGIGSVTHFMECCKSNPGDSIGKPIDPPRYLNNPTTWPTSHSLPQLRLDNLTVQQHI